MRSIGSINNYCINSKKIFYTVDLHFLRELREAKLYRDEFMTKKARLSFVNETEIMNSVDATVVLSEKEKNILNLIGIKNIYNIPLIRSVGEVIVSNYCNKNGILFIGGYRHRPNVDAVKFLVSEIWPKLRKELEIKGLKEKSY